MSNEELAERIKNGETDLILDLWEQVRKLVIKIINKRYLPQDGSTNWVELDDLLQAGFVGMTNTISDFDPSSGFKFTTYLGRHLANAAREALGIRSKKRDPLLDAVSMDKPISSGENSLTLGDMFQDKSAEYIYDDLIEDLAKKEDVRTIREQLKCLNPREREIFEARYFHGLSFVAIGEKHNCTKQSAYNTANRSLWKIRRSKAVQLISKERAVGRYMNFFNVKGLTAFNSTFSSSVEDIVILRERLRQSYLRG